MFKAGGDARDETTEWERLATGLAANGVRYLIRTGDAPDDCPDLNPEQLIEELARSNDPRLRDSLMALLLVNPEFADTALQIEVRDSTPEKTARWLRLSVVVAAALQNEWSFSLDIYLRGRKRIAADGVAKALGLPSPQLDFGRPALRAAAVQLRQGHAFPLNYEEGWEHSVKCLLGQLVRERRHES